MRGRPVTSLFLLFVSLAHGAWLRADGPAAPSQQGAPVGCVSFQLSQSQSTPPVFSRKSSKKKKRLSRRGLLIASLVSGAILVSLVVLFLSKRPRSAGTQSPVLPPQMSNEYFLQEIRDARDSYRLLSLIQEYKKQRGAAYVFPATSQDPVEKVFILIGQEAELSARFAPVSDIYGRTAEVAPLALQNDSGYSSVIVDLEKTLVTLNERLFGPRVQRIKAGLGKRQVVKK